MLREAAGWLTSLGVTHVAMEATGIYGMPVYHALLEHGQSGQVPVCNAGHVKSVPGRKTGLAGAGWLAHLLECGLLRGSFMPPADIKAVRDVIRYRAKVVRARSSEIQRLGGVLQDAGIKPGNVASSTASRSGRALTGGERRPGVLAGPAIGRMRSKTADLAMALEASSERPAASCWRWRTGCGPGAWSAPGWKAPATAGSRPASPSSGRASTACSTRRPG